MKTSKKLLTLCFALFVLVGYSQTKHLNNHKQHLSSSNSYSNQEITALKIELEVESLKELESSFKVEDLNKIFQESNVNDAIEFKITCIKQSGFNSDINKKISYKITDVINNKDAFIKNAEKIYEVAKKYYIN